MPFAQLSRVLNFTEYGPEHYGNDQKIMEMRKDFAVLLTYRKLVLHLWYL